MMKERKNLVVMTAAMLLLAFAGSASANLLVNGDLEDWDEGDTYPAGWENTGSGGIIERINTATSTDAIEGTSAYISRNSLTPSISQDVYLEAGQEYTLTVDLRRAASPYSSEDNRILGVQIRDVEGEYYIYNTTYEYTDLDVHHETITFTAPVATAIRIQFKASTRDNAGVFDNVVLTPEPATMMLLGLGGGLTLLKRRRRG